MDAIKTIASAIKMHKNAPLFVGVLVVKIRIKSQTKEITIAFMSAAQQIVFILLKMLLLLKKLMAKKVKKCVLAQKVRVIIIIANVLKEGINVLLLYVDV